MKQQIGIALQFIVLTFLPLLVIWQLNFGFRLVLMPMCLLASMFVFMIGTRLRES